MSEQYTIADYLIDRLKEVGVEHVFGVPGDFGFPFMDQIEAAAGLTWVGACNELNAAYAADGYARSRGIAAVTGSCGVLEAGAAGGIAGAFAEEVPLLVISGFPSVEEMAHDTVSHHGLRGRFDHFTAMLAPITAAQVMVTADDGCASIDRAIRDCWASKSPVYLQFPRDVQQLPAVPPATALVLPEPRSNPDELTHVLGVIAAMLRAAQRPAILVEHPLARYGLTDLVEELSAGVGIPLATTLTGRSGAIDQTAAQYLGFYGSPADTAATDRIDAADAVLRVCPRHLETNRGVADPKVVDDRLIDVQVDGVTVRGTVYPNVTARDVLAGLRAEMTAPAAPRPPRSGSQISPFTARAGVPITQDRLWEAFSGFVQDGDTLALDYGTIQSVSMMTLPVRTRALMQTSWAAIGWTTPAVAGSVLANPASRHLHVVGDGGFQETAQEVSMLLRYGLAPITIVVNNGSYQVENVIHQGSPVDKAYNRLHGWRYSQLPAALGGDTALGIRVQTEDELTAAFTAATAAHQEGRYTLIEVLVAQNDLATTFAQFTSGIGQR